MSSKFLTNVVALLFIIVIAKYSMKFMDVSLKSTTSCQVLDLSSKEGIYFDNYFDTWQVYGISSIRKALDNLDTHGLSVTPDYVKDSEKSCVYSECIGIKNTSFEICKPIRDLRSFSLEKQVLDFIHKTPKENNKEYRSIFGF